MATILAQVRAATLVHTTLSTNLVLGTDRIDGVLIAAGDRILVKAQTDQAQNGIYTLSSAGAWVRAIDFAIVTSATGTIGTISSINLKAPLLQGSTTFTATGTSVTGAGTYTAVTQSATSGTGTGATFTIVKTGSGTVYSGFITITITAFGTGYAVGDTITIPGNSLGGAAGTNNLTLTIGGTLSLNSWDATITNMVSGSTAGLTIGSNLLATNGTGSLYGGTPNSVTVTDIISATSVKYNVIGGTIPTAGTVTNIKSPQIGGTIVFVQEGSTLADTGWVISSNGARVIGSDTILFEKFTINLKLEGASVTGSMILREEKGYPLTTQELDNNFKYLSTSVTQKLNTIDFTPTAIVSRINTLTAGEGNINAWKLNGYLPDASSTINTVVVRDANGDITTDVFHGELDGNSATSTLAVRATIANNVDGIVALANGGTGAITPLLARANLGAVALSGDSMEGKLTFTAGNLSRASFNIPTKVADIASPVNGDVWADSVNIFYRKNDITQTIASLASPTFTGTVSAPTAPTDSNNTTVANTAHVKNVKVLIDTSIALKATIDSPTFTGTPLSTTPETSDSSTKIATTALVGAKIDSALTSYTTTIGMNSAISTALTSYTTTTGMNSAISTALTSYYTKTNIDTQLTNYYTTTAADTAIANAVSSKASTSYVSSLQDQWGTSKKFVQTADPGSAAANGDIWFKI